uniref:Uncharacterized protein n=1 Tax=Candidatus Kentrum sp. DK TaxID=2126562 RepID=A0A450TLW9_9GAMM|nr:MAG: hypothetical protein BECKDK2373C_GA0170839_11926 [Candidatus Kentron sp. DK]
MPNPTYALGPGIPAGMTWRAFSNLVRENSPVPSSRQADWRDPEAKDGMLLLINFRETAIALQSNPNIRAAVVKFRGGIAYKLRFLVSFCLVMKHDPTFA